MIPMSIQQIKHNWILLFCFLATLGGTILFSAYTMVKNPNLKFDVVEDRSIRSNYSKEIATAGGCSVHSEWIYHMHAWTNKKGPYSQGSQDLYLEKIFSVIHTTNKYFVEFGFNVPSYKVGGSGANTRKLYEDGWRGLLLDGNNENAEINLKKHYLFATNIVGILTENLVPKDLDYLSCDMDSHDLWVFRAILEGGYRPRVITTEFNANYPITDALTLLDPTMIRSGTSSSNYQYKFVGCSWGVGAGALRIVAETHGYTMVGIVGLLDIIRMRNDLLVKECFHLPAFEWFFQNVPIGKLYHRAQSSSEILLQIIDYETYLRTGGNITASNQAARTILKKQHLPCYEKIEQFL